MLEIIRYECARILSRSDFAGKTPKAIDDPGLLIRVAKGFFKARLRALTSRKAMIGHNGGALCQHERKLCVQDRLAIESAVLPDRRFARAETILASYEERQVAIVLALVCLAETHQATPIIVL